MVTFLLFVQAVLCSVILYREIIKRSFRYYLTSLFFLVYAVVYIIEPLILHIAYGGARSIEKGADIYFEDVYVYLIFNLIGISLLSSGVILSLQSTFVNSQIKQLYQPKKFLTDSIGLLIIIGTALFIYSTGFTFDEILIASRFSWVENSNFQPVLGVVSAYFLALAGVHMYLLRSKASSSKVITIMAITAVVIYGIVTKDRKWIFLFVSGWLAAIYYSSGFKINVTSRIVAGFLGLFVFVLLSQFIRDAVPRYLLEENFDITNEIYTSIDYIFQYSDLSYFYRATIEAIHQFLNNGFQIPLGLVRRTVFLIIPQSWSGDLEVEDISATFSDVIGGEDALRRGNMPPGLFGLFVLSFGWIGSVCLMPLLALSLFAIDKICLRRVNLLQLTLITFIPTSVIFAFRGDESTAIYFPVISFILLVMIDFTLNLVKLKSSKI